MSQKRYSTDYKLAIVDRIENGESRNSVAKKTGLSTLTIKSWIDRKDQLIQTLLEEAKNRKNTNRKKRYNEKVKEIVVKRIEDGESVYKVSKELGIPYLTVKNWVIVTLNKEPAEKISIPDTSDVIISEEEKQELISYMEENAKKETPEDSMLRSIDKQNEEIADLKKQISELQEEIDMLKKAAIAFAKMIPSDVS